ncbi:hypothetical protein M2399_001442 [Pseudomonas sp. BIGb0450]|nr:MULTISPECIES: hypothetical protein [unclassified Pseudomonas]MCS3416753.1 hypothetical protein [Pseudomonas sp. BIGb0558]MCS3436021.1 hypothetical protein [Pseudomonas sp. BIGb0450]
MKKARSDAGLFYAKFPAQQKSTVGAGLARDSGLAANAAGA